jgi:hypothetical protein
LLDRLFSSNILVKANFLFLLFIEYFWSLLGRSGCLWSVLRLKRELWHVVVLAHELKRSLL